MSCGNVGNIRIEPVNCSWEIEEQWHVLCSPDVSLSLQNKYFTIRDADDDKHHVWFNVNGAGADPAPASSTGHPVAIATNASASTIAAAIATALSGAYATKQIQDLLYTARNAGTAGNSITIDYNSGGTAGSEVVGVVSSAITVTIETGVSTAQQIATALGLSAAAMALVSVAVDSNDSADPQVSFGAAVNLTGGASASTDFEATSDGDEVTITTIGAADVTDYADYNTDFVLTQCQEGGLTDLGLLDGNVEPAFEEKLLEIMAHQSGSNILAELRQGVSVEVPMTLKECDAAHLRDVFASAGGGAHTPALGTELFGWGSSRLGQPTIRQARRLVLHPVALASSNKARDLCFWKAYPIPDTLVFSGEDPETLSLSFKCYLDDSKPEEVSMFSYGDWSQLIPGA
jgi:hypothetical protein